MTQCHCGQPLHYPDPEMQAAVERLIVLAGTPFVEVRVGHRTWRVPRHYIALHGLRAWELPDLGFEEVGQ